MDPQLTALASTAASAVVNSLASDAWEQAKNGLGALWRRVHPQRAETVDAELVETRTQLLAARQDGDERTEEELVGEWSGRLRRLLNAHPALGDELQRLVDRLSSDSPGDGVRIGELTMHAHASGKARVYQAGRDQHIIER